MLNNEKVIKIKSQIANNLYYKIFSYHRTVITQFHVKLRPDMFIFAVSNITENFEIINTQPKFRDSQMKNHAQSLSSVAEAIVQYT